MRKRHLKPSFLTILGDSAYVISEWKFQKRVVIILRYKLWTTKIMYDRITEFMLHMNSREVYLFCYYLLKLHKQYFYMHALHAYIPEVTSWIGPSI